MLVRGLSVEKRSAFIVCAMCKLVAVAGAESQDRLLVYNPTLFNGLQMNVDLWP